MLKGKVDFKGKSGGGKGTEDCLCAPGRVSSSAQQLWGQNGIFVPGY